ncbi:MAG: hypothetical protein EKK42_32870 [Pseudonocardiaceae bacterium]|nr:MAG: hypothetical protein EKK42_32870 [Pseudonocardiaceae bacterium]
MTVSAASNFRNVSSPTSSDREVSSDPKRDAAAVRRFYPFAQNRLHDFEKREARNEATRVALFQQDQNVLKTIQALGVKLNAAQSSLATAKREHRRAWEFDIELIEAEIEDNKAARAEIRAEMQALTSPFDPNLIRKVMLRSDGTKLKEFVPDLPHQTPDDDAKMLASVRAEIDSFDAKFRDLDLGQLPLERALEKAMADIDKIEKGSAPDFSRTLRLQTQPFSKDRKQGEVVWPQRHLRGDEWETDPLRILFWLCGDEIRKRAKAEIKKLAKPGALSVAEREAKRKELESERFDLWRIEEALTTRLRESGRTDIDFRSAMPIQVLLRFDL